MRPAGGVFLICIGAGLIGAIVFSGAALVNYGVFFAGAALGVASLVLVSRSSTERPTRVQIAALNVAIALEVLLFVAMGRMLPPGTSEHVRWLWVSAIVGIHFLPMSLAFGARFLLLGGLCVANAAAGLVFSHIPYEPFGLIDGVLKVSVGVWCVSGRYFVVSQLTRVR